MADKMDMLAIVDTGHGGHVGKVGHNEQIGHGRLSGHGLDIMIDMVYFLRVETKSLLNIVACVYK